MPEGENPIANVNWRFKWLWLYAFVHPQTGETYWWILPYVNTELFNRVLEDFACELKLGAKKRVLLAIDQAGWHISKELIVKKMLAQSWWQSGMREASHHQKPSGAAKVD